MAAASRGTCLSRNEREQLHADHARGARGSLPREVLRLATISDNTNSSAATNDPSFHRHRHWFAAKNLSWRSPTQSWTLAGTPPKEVPACSVMRKKKVPIRILWSRRAKALAQWLCSFGIGSWRGLSQLTARVAGLTQPIPPTTPSPPSDRACRSLR